MSIDYNTSATFEPRGDLERRSAALHGRPEPTSSRMNTCNLPNDSRCQCRAFFLSRNLNSQRTIGSRNVARNRANNRFKFLWALRGGVCYDVESVCWFSVKIESWRAPLASITPLSTGILDHGNARPDPARCAAQCCKRWATREDL